MGVKNIKYSFSEKHITILEVKQYYTIVLSVFHYSTVGFGTDWRCDVLWQSCLLTCITCVMFGTSSPLAAMWLHTNTLDVPSLRPNYAGRYTAKLYRNVYG